MSRILDLDTLSETDDLAGRVIQNLDLRGVKLPPSAGQAVFLGCRFDPGVLQSLVGRGAVALPPMGDLPYNPYRGSLYGWEELLSCDLRIYEHFVSCGRHRPPVLEALAQRLHDHAIDAALRELLTLELRPVGLMGGHGMLRTDPLYSTIARLAAQLVQAGYYMVTGGGPGVMEAGNLGAYLAGHPPEALDQAIDLLKVAPGYRDPGYVEAGTAVLERFPTGLPSLAVPTWFYGHEPSNVFASQIAKYFSNSLREDTLLAICVHGIIYCPGSAGTTQEIFQDAAQNHYGTYGYYSPMVFFGEKRYRQDTGIYSLLEGLAAGRPYRDMLFLSDDPAAVVDFLQRHPPVSASG